MVKLFFHEMIASGIRGFSGKCLIDLNDLYPDFKSTAKKEIKDIISLAQNIS